MIVEHPAALPPDPAQLHPLAHAEARARLLAGPWCWPREGTPEFEAALRICPEGPPPARRGEIVVVSVTNPPRRASLWVVGNERGLSDLLETSQGLSNEVLNEAERVAVCLPRQLPVLWKKVERRPPGKAWRLDSVYFPGPGGVPFDTALIGPSYGLSLLLLVTARCFGVAVPPDVIASAVVDTDGRVDEVDGLAEKLAAIAHCAPRIERVLVAARQAEAARRIVEQEGLRPLHVVPVRTVSEAVSAVWGEKLESLLVDCDPAEREDVVWALVQLIVDRRGALVDYSPVHAAALRALESWRDLSETDRRKLLHVKAVAERHVRNRGEVPFPTDEELSALDAGARYRWLQDLVQQSTDTGTPPAGLAEALALRHLGDTASVRRLDDHQLRLLGALARLYAVTGRERKALELQQAIAAAFLERGGFDDISFQLAEWYRLAGALGDEAAWHAAQRFEERALQRGSYPPNAVCFVQLARLRGAVALGSSGDGMRRELESLATSPEVPDHVCDAAARWLAVMLEARGLPGADRVLARLQPAADEPRAYDDSRHAASLLVQMQRALARGASEHAAELAERFAELEPGIAGHLRTSPAPGESFAERLLRLYPY